MEFLSADVGGYASPFGWFKIETRLGSHMPEWAGLVKRQGEDELSFAIETKSNLLTGDLRTARSVKIDCGKALCEALCTNGSPSRCTMSACCMMWWGE